MNTPEKDSHPVENYKYYLIACAGSEEPASVEERHCALVAGYFYALHKIRIYDPEITFTKDPSQITKDDINGMTDEIRTLLAIHRPNNAIFCDIDHPEPSEYTASILCSDFLAGYVTAIDVESVYDDTLFLQGEELRQRVFADLLAQETKDAAKAHAAAYISKQYIETSETAAKRKHPHSYK